MVGADLANLVNEAALLAARRNREKVTTSDLNNALERIVLGAERKVVLSEDDRRRTAYHESGHAIVGMLTPGADPVRKVSIIPRGQALGVTFSAPDADRFNFEQHMLLAQIKVALGGRTAEECAERCADYAVAEMDKHIGPDNIACVVAEPVEGEGSLDPGAHGLHRSHARVRALRGHRAAPRRPLALAEVSCRATPARRAERPAPPLRSPAHGPA